mgnify:CR=1 FL=1
MAVFEGSSPGSDHKAQLPGFTDEERGPERLTNLPEAKGLVDGLKPQEFSFPWL